MPGGSGLSLRFEPETLPFPEAVGMRAGLSTVNDPEPSLLPIISSSWAAAFFAVLRSQDESEDASTRAVIKTEAVFITKGAISFYEDA